MREFLENRSLLLIYLILSLILLLMYLTFQGFLSWSRWFFKKINARTLESETIIQFWSEEQISIPDQLLSDESMYICYRKKNALMIQYLFKIDTVVFARNLLHI